LEPKRRQTDARLEIFKQACREYGLKITPQRVAIFQEFHGSAEHPSAVMIYDKVRQDYPHISLDTVSRTLTTLNKIGLAKEVEFSGEARRFDPNLDRHHHFRCIKCGHIVDFNNEIYDSIVIPEELKMKYTVLEKKVCLEGICDRCRAGD